MNKLIFGYSVPDQDDEEWEVDEAEWAQAGENIWNVRFEMKRERETEREIEREWLILKQRSHVIEDSPENACEAGGSAEVWPEVITMMCESV